MAYLVPQGTVRLEVLGFRDVPLRGDALDRARRLVREGLEQGAVGFSTGSKYYPGPWADTQELIELCRVVREAGSVYMCEPRSANLERAHGGHGVKEAVEVARRTGVRLHFAHYRTAPATAGQVGRLMEFIDPPGPTARTSRSTSTRTPPAARSPSACSRARRRRGDPTPSSTASGSGRAPPHRGVPRPSRDLAHRPWLTSCSRIFPGTGTSRA